MCGITGVFLPGTNKEVPQAILEKMVEVLHHRGPDDKGFFSSSQIGLAQSRLSIIDLAGGKQPIHNEDRTIWVVFNGEIFNYIELGEELAKRGHRFYTRSDTEVIVHAYEEFGRDFLSHLNGQFAIALWDEKRKNLLLARDRVGIRPLYYGKMADGTFLFGSEMKAIFKYPGFPREIDPEGIHQVFKYWVNVPPKTTFKQVFELPPAHFLEVNNAGMKIHRYWKLTFPRKGEYEDRPLDYYRERLRELIYDATTIRLRADVPVAAYLSGGIDSSIISALVKKYHNNDLITFSVAFHDKDYDERRYQEEMVRFLKTDHRLVEVNYETIGNSFVDVVWFAEKPMIRTAPGPLYLLSGLVRENGIKVVLTGEGADEVFGGYNIFKEDKIRRFWARYPQSTWRPLLLTKLYPYIVKNGRQSNAFWLNFFKKNLLDTENPLYSHLIRWENTNRINSLLAADFIARYSSNSGFEDVLAYIDPEITSWHPLSRAQYLEMQLFMAGYLLSSQGDRMMMGHSVEGRFPYLDHRVIEFASQIPPYYKIRGLNEKYVLKKTFRDLVPESIVNRNKQPYRAPISQCFLMEDSSPLIKELISPEKIRAYGYFDPRKVEILINKLKRQPGHLISARDDMSIVAIVSLQLLHYHFIKNFPT